MSEGETDAQVAFADARRALNKLAAMVASPATISGPCTAYLHELRPRLSSLLKDEQWRAGHRWRQHSADRDTRLAWVVDTYGAQRMTVVDKKGHRSTRALTPRELACLALVYKAPMPTDATTVFECIDHVTRAVREDQRRRKRARAKK